VVKGRIAGRSAEMKTFACGAVVPGCSASFSADTEEEVLAQVDRHAREDHGMPEVPDELVQLVLVNLR
jgi:predicted small metal-binding protein